MNTFTTRTAVAVSALLLATACGTDTGATPTRGVERKAPQVEAGATYDGWAARLRRESTPPTCPFTPDQVQRMIESGAPLPACVRRSAHWFEDEFKPLARPARGTDR